MRDLEEIEALVARVRELEAVLGDGIDAGMAVRKLAADSMRARDAALADLAARTDALQQAEAAAESAYARAEAAERERNIERAAKEVVVATLAEVQAQAAVMREVVMAAREARRLLGIAFSMDVVDRSGVRMADGDLCRALAKLDALQEARDA